ncbi:MAG TPA: hypothetical protein VFH61_07305 [Thermoleophilia bacterium]|nr:hypothetical protein [Thermoleophilia bacterium]
MRLNMIVAPNIPDADWMVVVLMAEGLFDRWRVTRGGTMTYADASKRTINLGDYDCRQGRGEDYATVDDYLLRHGDGPTGPGADLALISRHRAAFLHELTHATLVGKRHGPSHGTKFCRAFARVLRVYAPSVYTPYKELSNKPLTLSREAV